MNALEEMEDYTKRLTEYVQVLKERSSREKLEELSQLRFIRMETLEKHDIFYVKDMAEMLVPKYLKYLDSFGVISNTNRKPIYHDRWVIPIKNEEGNILGLVGYSNTASERYVYSTSKYYDRLETLYGLETMPEALDLGYALVTEGITDTLAIRDVGYPNTYAYCGTRYSEYKLKVLNRLRYGTINIHDRDFPGDNTKKSWNTNRHFTFITPVEFKDSSATLSKDNGINQEWFKQCMDMAIEWIKTQEHNGMRCACAESTMI